MEEQASVISYLMETRERMEVVRQMVVEVETQAKKNQKRHNNKKARTRNFEEDSKVFVLLPTSSSTVGSVERSIRGDC